MPPACRVLAAEDVQFPAVRSMFELGILSSDVFSLPRLFPFWGSAIVGIVKRS